MISRTSRQDDRPRTGSQKPAAGLREFLDRFYEIEASESLRNRRAFATGQDQPLEALEITRREHAPPSSAEAFEGGEMFLDVPLNSENTDDRRRVRHA